MTGHRLLLTVVSCFALSLAALSACQSNQVFSNGLPAPPKPTPRPAKPSVAPGPNYEIASDSSADFGPETARQFGCSSEALVTKSDLGGLSPKLPIAVCPRFWRMPDQGQMSESPSPAPSPQPTALPAHPLMAWTSFLTGGVSHSVYLVKTPEGIQVLGSVDQVRDFYAPIESPAEALSYLLAVTDAIQLLNNTALPDPGEAFWLDDHWAFRQGAVYRVSQLEATRVEAQGDGFVVKNILRDRDCIPTGEDTLASSSDYRVSRSGEIQLLQSTEIFSFGPCPIE